MSTIRDLDFVPVYIYKCEVTKLPLKKFGEEGDYEHLKDVYVTKFLVGNAIMYERQRFFASSELRKPSFLLLRFSVL
jgi:hypothetical protein